MMKKYAPLFILPVLIAISAGALAYQIKNIRPLEKRNFSEDLLTGKTLEIKKPDAISIILVGDIMLSRNVGKKIREANDPDLPFLNVRSFLESADLTFGNLEAPFLDAGEPVTEGMSFKAEPEYISGLVNSGFDAVSCANNHVLDRGLAGINFTRQLLQENGIAAAGCGTDATEARRPAILEVRDKKVAVLAYTYSPLSARTAGLEISAMKKNVENAKNQADIIIVSMHAGTEYVLSPTEQQRSFARAAVDAGADIVVGHHPHWVQPVEMYCPKHPSPTPPIKEGESATSSLPLVGRDGEEVSTCGLIFYSLGNFVFDQSWSQKTREGLAVKLYFSGGNLDRAELVPMIMDNNCCPRPADPRETEDILKAINASPIMTVSPGKD